MYYLNALGLVCPLGDSKTQVQQRMFRGDTGLLTTDCFSPGRPLALGRVTTSLPACDDWPVGFQSRNNQLAMQALLQIQAAVEAAKLRFGAHRIAVILGTSTSGIAEGERAIQHLIGQGTMPTHFHYAQQEMGSTARFVASQLGVAGPCYVHSTACASAAKAMASAARLLASGVVDAAITGGVDSLCAFTIAGFSALDSVSEGPCNPLSVNRKGINIGEAAALFLMTREPATVALSGWGESSDGYHMSAPEPNGAGARVAIESALARANLTAAQIEYINLHGTATLQNDAMESRITHSLFGGDVPVSSSKGMVGHTLGAAGAIEAAFCWLSMQDDNPTGFLPPHLWDGEPDPTLPTLHTVAVGEQLGHPPQHVLSNSFAFGGANASLVFSRRAS
ncbi:3-oxoacyl-[acyl-carrier-protein] synthase-1 [Chitinivorax tropicus]|uniref:3-oxoacyl-[acyl-carrier-protein] synthase-1 n=1 Tax=Chitinivorax tropicus TaxID=714531 RepID=A0A840MMK4_9PROT|nr:beta-ketoacyl-ACP synthase [Chitinivorax tropicus]MBB5017433.1 3-oxoacyl-[acyl-carrier-protein] synthase-1 [Chitinivorax tropicus]